MERKEQAEEEPVKKQPKLEESQEEENDGELPPEEFLKPELACEIYAALPAAHQRRLLTLCRDIAELGPSPDQWVRWKIFTWTGNRWNPNDCSHPDVQISANGLNLAVDNDAWHYESVVRGIHPVQFPPTRTQGPQICYFEIHAIKGWFRFGFCARDSNPEHNSQNFFGLTSGGLYENGTLRQWLPDVDISDVDCVIGCGLIKHLGQRKIFFTKDGQLLAQPIRLPANTTNELFPFIMLFLINCRLEDTIFGLRPFMFKYEGNEAKLLEEMVLN